MTDRTPIIRLEGISKAFGPVQANRDITLDIQAGRCCSRWSVNRCPVARPSSRWRD